MNKLLSNNASIELSARWIVTAILAIVFLAATIPSLTSFNKFAKAFPVLIITMLALSIVIEVLWKMIINN